MPEYIVPKSHLGLLQRIVMALILKEDPDATFVDEDGEPLESLAKKKKS